MNLFKKLFCGHKWKKHAKTQYTKGSNFDALIFKNKYEYTQEILICEHCGKIKKIEY